MTRCPNTPNHAMGNKYWNVCKLAASIYTIGALHSAWAETALTPSNIDCLFTISESTDALLQKQQACQSNMAWLNLVGQRLNAERRFSEASEHLERALLLAPTDLSATLAFSIALAGSGDITSASNLINQLATRAELTSAQQADIRTIQTLLSGTAYTLNTPRPTAATSAWKRSVTWRAGHDNNLRGSPNLSSLTLNMPGGDIQLPLDTTQRPQPGVYQRLDARLDWVNLINTGENSPRRTDLTLLARDRRNPAAQDTNSLQLETLLSTRPSQHSGWLASAGWSSLHTRSGTRFQQWQATGGYSITPLSTDQCQASLNAETQHRQLDSSPILSGRYWGVAIDVACQLTPSPTGPPTQLYGSIKSGKDTPTLAQRPGGAQHNIGMRAGMRSGPWTIEAEFTRTQDQTGYSPLLANNSIRHVSRTRLLIDRQWTLPSWAGGAKLHTGIEHHQQHSNIQLFKVDSTSPYSDLRWNW